jgi:hypothetical protein
MYTITEDDVRNFMFDRTLEDNELTMDLSFSPEEIKQAMIRAAREYNSLAPVGVDVVDPSRLDGTTNIFLDGTVAQLYIAALNKLSRNEVDYTSGGVGTSLDKTQKNNYMKLIELHTNRFKEAAYERKININLQRGFMQVG